MRQIIYVKVEQKEGTRKNAKRANVTPFCAHVGKPNNNMKTIDTSQTFLYNEDMLLVQEYCNKHIDLIEHENACLAKLSS